MQLCEMLLADILESSTEHKLYGLKQSLLHFQHLLKYSTFTVLMDYSALKHIYCFRKPAKTVLIQNFCRKFQTFHLISTISLASTCLSLISCRHFSSNNKDEEPILYLTDTTLLDDASYMFHLDGTCQFNYDTLQGVWTSHTFPLTRSRAKLQKIAIPSLFKTIRATSGPNPKASVLIASKRSTALTSIDLNQTAFKKRGCGCPPLNRTIQHTPLIADIDDNIVEDMNETLPMLFPVRRRRRQASPLASLPTIQPDWQLPCNDDEMALKHIHICNLTDNVEL